MDPAFLEETSASLGPAVAAGPLGWRWGWWVLELARKEQRRKGVPTPAVTSVGSSFKRLDDN